MVGGIRPRRRMSDAPADNAEDGKPPPFKRSRRLRSSETASERKLWQALRRKQIRGVRFRRQHPIGSYFADFICIRVKLVIEVDGLTHITPEQIAHDERRTQ